MISTLFSSTDFVQTVELWPPSYPVDGPAKPLEKQFSWLSERLDILGEYFDAFHVADLKVPGRRYLDPVMTAVSLRDRFRWLEVAPTISARDRNTKALQEAVAASLFFGLDNLILVRGDPYLAADPDRSKNVYDVPGVSGLVKLARGVQSSISHANLCIMTPVDLSRLEDEKYLDVIRQREEATSNVFLSQMFFGDPDDYLSMLDHLRSEGIRSPVLHNIFPFYSYDDAVDVSLRFKVHVAKPTLDQLKEGGVSAGVKAASRFRDVLRANRGKVNGIFVSSRGEPELAIRLAE